MSAATMSAIEYPPSVYAAPILANHWPEQSEYVWQAYSAQLRAEWVRLVEQESAQMSIKMNLDGQTSVGMIPGINRMVAKRDGTLADRIAAVAIASPAADAVRASIVNLKSDLYWIVMSADQKIKDLEAKAGIGAAATLPAEIAAIVAAAQTEAADADAARAGEVTAKTAELLSWTPQGSAKQSGGSGAATPLSTGIGGEGAYSPPLSPNSGSGVQAVDYNTLKQGSPADVAHGEAKQAEKPMLSNEAREAAWKPNALDPKDAATAANPDRPLPAPSHSSPPMSSAPSSGGSSSGGSPSSVIGQMMRPPASSSPASSSPSSSSGSGLSSGGSSSASPAAAHAGGPGSPAGAGAPGGAGAAPGIRGAGLASAGSGIAESSARMASGAVNATANAIGTAGNMGSQVAQGATAAATQAAPPPAAGAPPAAASAPVSGAPVGGAPVGMVPAGAAGGPAVISPVTGGGPAVGGGPATTPAAGATPVSSVGGATPQVSAGSSLAPVPVQMSPGVRGVGADGATGDVLFTQAMDAGRDVITALLAQTKGYMAIDYAVSVMWERTGQVSAWLATSEGASYIPLGVRVPQDVALAINDQLLGRQLWDETAAAGGGDPLEVVVRHAQAREMAAPGTRVLAIASSVKMDRVQDWAGEVKARPVSVNPNTVAKDIELPPTRHRCQVAMPWEWQQAHAFSEEERHRIAARHVMMAAVEGHLHSPACEKVMDLFESRKPIDDALWPEVTKERFMALLAYQSAMSNAGLGGAEDPARALATARATEVVECLRTHATAEGCADLLYATRLAGAPLSPGEAAV